MRIMSRFKPDCARRIDRAIDYFGETARCCGGFPPLGASELAGRQLRQSRIPHTRPTRLGDTVRSRGGAGGTETPPWSSRLGISGKESHSMKLLRWTIVPVLALSITAAAGSAGAAEATAERIALKAARGVDNTLLGLIGDWPKTVYYQSRDNGLPYGMTVGVVQGLAVGLARTGVGLYELATFPVPVPTGYRPILSPQFSLEPQETRIAE